MKSEDNHRRFPQSPFVVEVPFTGSKVLSDFDLMSFRPFERFVTFKVHQPLSFVLLSTG